MPLFSPHGRINQVPPSEIFDAVRYVMFRWGFIGAFRADNGAPFGEPTRQALSPFNLCLRAHGVTIKLNPPRSPKRNAKVERNQGTTARWAHPADCHDYLELQQKLNQAVEDQREHYPTRTCKNQTRSQRFPELFDNPKKFHVEDFDMHRVFKFLAKGSWQRKISSEGTTDMFGKTYQVGYPHRRKSTTVTFDMDKQAWVFKDERGLLLNTIKAENICQNNIRDLSFGQ
jgi:hypothetical protein